MPLLFYLRVFTCIAHSCEAEGRAMHVSLLETTLVPGCFITDYTARYAPGLLEYLVSGVWVVQPINACALHKRQRKVVSRA